MSSCTPTILGEAPGVAPGGLADLPDEAQVRICACAPALPASAAIGANIAALFDQLAREQRLSAHASTVTCAGSVVVLAWVGPAISGCAGDRVNRLLGSLGERWDLDLLSPPPIVVELAGTWTCVNRAGLRAAIAAGQVTAATRMANTQVTTLGAWRHQGLTTIGQSWAGSLFPTR